MRSSPDTGDLQGFLGEQRRPRGKGPIRKALGSKTVQRLVLAGAITIGVPSAAAGGYLASRGGVGTPPPEKPAASSDVPPPSMKDVPPAATATSTSTPTPLSKVAEARATRVAVEAQADEVENRAHEERLTQAARDRIKKAEESVRTPTPTATPTDAALTKAGVNADVAREWADRIIASDARAAKTAVVKQTYGAPGASGSGEGQTKKQPPGDDNTGGIIFSLGALGSVAGVVVALLQERKRAGSNWLSKLRGAIKSRFGGRGGGGDGGLPGA